jgi:hypothetical protein
MTTLSQLLFDDEATGRRVLTRALGPAGTDVARLDVAGLSVDPPQVSGALLRLLDLPLANVALEGWNQHARVAAARTRTAASPGSREVLDLGEHTVTWSQSPVLEAWVGGMSAELLSLDLDVEVRVTAVTLVVEGGRVAEVHPGPARARASLRAGGRTLASHELRSVDLSPATDTAAPGVPA